MELVVGTLIFQAWMIRMQVHNVGAKQAKPQFAQCAARGSNEQQGLRPRMHRWLRA